MWERLLLASRLGGTSRDQTIMVLERRLLVAGLRRAQPSRKPLPREILAKFTALGPTRKKDYFFIRGSKTSVSGVPIESFLKSG